MLCFSYPPVAQLVERRAYTSVVPGSSPGGRTLNTGFSQYFYCLSVRRSFAVSKAWRDLKTLPTILKIEDS